MFDWLFSGDTGMFLGAFGFITGIASLIYARSQARGAHAQVESARKQAVEALRAAELVAKGAREQAVEALRAAGLVAENARERAVKALTAAGLVAENARLQAAQALRAAELVANAGVSARVREMRARNLRFNPALPAPVHSMMKQAGGPDAYGLLLDAIDIAQEIYSLRKAGVVSDDQWRMWINDQIGPMAASSNFQAVFRQAAKNGSVSRDFAASFEPILLGHPIHDPWIRSIQTDGHLSRTRNGHAPVGEDSGPAGAHRPPSSQPARSRAREKSPTLHGLREGRLPA